MSETNHSVQHKTVAELARELAQGVTSAESLAATCLERIADPAGEGARAFIDVHRDKALDQARASDMMRRHGVSPSPLAGLPVSIKDLFDVAGEVTRAASTILASSSPAQRDAPVIARLRAAGAVFIGRTNMTEFAYSGVGINPHYGTPASPWDRETGRIPGGSTSGGAVSVADGMAALAIGSDTGGSCRIPAALCGIVGFKPTAARIPRTGVFPLSKSFDSIGALGNSVACVALADALMADEPYEPPIAGTAKHLRLAIPRTLVFDGIEEPVSKAFEAAVKILRDSDAQIEEIPLEALGEVPVLLDKGGMLAVEALAVHRDRIATHSKDYDPRVRDRILLGGDLSGADYVQLVDKRADLIARVTRTVAPYDALILPTVPVVAPPFSAFAADDEYIRLNRLLLRNSNCFNMLDGCAISLPCHRPGEASVGLMLAAMGGQDKKLLDIAATVETALAPLRAA